MKKKAILILIALCMAFPGTGFTAAGKGQAAGTAAQESTAADNKENETAQGSSQSTAEQGKYSDVSVLTGEAIDPELAKKRPIAVMLPIDKEAQPQYGLSNIDVLVF